MSIDLAFNDMVDLLACTVGLQGNKNLKCLTLAGNPLCLYKFYRRNVIRGIPSLKILDDVKVDDAKLSAVDHSEPAAAGAKTESNQKLSSGASTKSMNALSSSGGNDVGASSSDMLGNLSGSASREFSTVALNEAKGNSKSRNVIEANGSMQQRAQILVDFSCIRDLPAPLPLQSEDPGNPPDEYKFGIKIHMQGYSEVVTSTFLPWQEGALQFSDKLVMEFDVEKKFRNALRTKDGGLKIELIQRRIHYDPKPEPEEAPAPGKKGKPAAAAPKKKKGAAFTPEELESLYDAVVSEEMILWTKIIPTRVLLDGMTDQVLCEGGWPVELPEALLEQLAEAAEVEAKKKKGGKKNAVPEPAPELKTELVVDFFLGGDGGEKATIFRFPPEAAPVSNSAI